MKFARASLLRRMRSRMLLRGLLPIFVFMAYGCLCAHVEHSNSEHHIDSVAEAPPLHAMAASGTADYTNRSEKCHDDLPVGSTPGGRAGAGLSLQNAPATSPVLQVTGWASWLASGRERSPPGVLSHASQLEVHPTRATALAVLCVFRS